MLSAGATVQVTGLTNAAHLNGLAGKLGRFLPGKGRHEVDLGKSHGVKLILPANLVVTAAAAAACLDGAGEGKKGAAATDAGDTAATGAVDSDGVAVACSICLETLRAPCTLPCGHNFCFQCTRAALETVSRCPACRATVPDAAAAMLTPNLLLGELVGAQQGGSAEAAAAPAEAAALRQQRTKHLRPSVDWTLFVDFLSPACLSVLAVVEELQIEARQLRVVEQRTVWCDDVKKCEYEKTTRSQCVPRLEYGTFRLNFHRFDRFELDLRGHTQPWGAAFSCLRLKWADMVLI